MSAVKKARGKIGAVELFAGSARICKAFACIDQKAVAYDKHGVDERMELCSDFGFVLATSLVISACPGGLI
eukprot:9788327-Prorocentrum_lima.AAC.1